MKTPMLQAHRGVSTDFPENTMSAFIGAKEQGYPIIELDPGVTKDGKIVLLHDGTINRTGRKKDGQKIEEPTSISELTYDELINEYDFGLWFSEEFKGEKIPLLSEALEFAVANDMYIKIDNKFQKFSEESIKDLFEIVAKSEARIGFTCSDLKFVRMVLEALPDIDIHYDGAISREILEELTQLIDKDKLVVWVPCQTSLTTWVKIDFADEALCDLVKEYACLGVWILGTDEEYDEAVARFQPDIIETTGGIKPRK